jgi:hypothetical protein
LQNEKVAGAGPDAQVAMLIRICGYSAGHPLPEIWDVGVSHTVNAPQITMLRGEDGYGINWAGEYEPLDRLILGIGTGFVEASNASGLALNDDKRTEIIGNGLYEHMALPAMPIQDAIDLARYLVEVTAGFVRFSLRKQPKTVGGAVETAAITKHEGFKWVQVSISIQWR